MKVQFFGTIKKGRLTLRRPDIFRGYVQGQKDGDYYIEITKSKGPEKTNSQLSYYYAVIIPTVHKQLIEFGNESFVVPVGESGEKKFKEVPITEEVVDLLLKEACAKFDGKTVTLKRNMSQEECSEFIDRVIRWAARYLSCVIPEPEV